MHIYQINSFVLNFFEGDWLVARHVCSSDSEQWGVAILWDRSVEEEKREKGHENCAAPFAMEIGEAKGKMIIERKMRMCVWAHLCASLFFIPKIASQLRLGIMWFHPHNYDVDYGDALDFKTSHYFKQLYYYIWSFFYFI